MSELSEECIRASWEAERVGIREWCIKEKNFAPKRVDRFTNNFIDSMVYAGIPCGSRNGIVAAARRAIEENRHFLQPDVS